MDIYYVEEIQGIRVDDGTNEPRFLVKWFGYGKSSEFLKAKIVKRRLISIRFF